MRNSSCIHRCSIHFIGAENATPCAKGTILVRHNVRPSMRRVVIMLCVLCCMHTSPADGEGSCVALLATNTVVLLVL